MSAPIFGRSSLQSPLADGFARHMAGWSRESGGDEQMAARLGSAVAMSLDEGHVCVHLRDLGIARDDAHASGLVDAHDPSRDARGAGIEPPRHAPVMPLVLDADGRLYLQRYFDLEQRLASCIVELIGAASLVEPDLLEPKREKAGTATGPVGVDPDWQKLAVHLAREQRLTIISGGPGTGKTTTVLELLEHRIRQNPAMRIALAAPTGKAAARMSEALRKGIEKRQRGATLSPPGALPSSELAWTDRIPAAAFTVHRLLGTRPGAHRPRHHARNPLPCDLVVIDEASMLDLALATRLFEALAPGSSLILLGDKDQLSAVEPGAVFAELSAHCVFSEPRRQQLAKALGVDAARITDSPAPDSGNADFAPLRDHVAWLRKSWRFSDDSDIGRLARGLQALRGPADARALIEALEAVVFEVEDTASDRRHRELQWQTTAPVGVGDFVEAYRELLDLIAEGVRADAPTKATDAQSTDAQSTFVTRLLKAFDRHRLLCAVREGPQGTVHLNRAMDAHARAAAAAPADRPWYPGRPVQVTRNDPALGLFNGDTGICWPGADGRLRAWFERWPRGLVPVPVARLENACESAWATTIHRSQGSEFDSVHVLLPFEPGEGQRRLLTRELLYTGVTRARSRVRIVAPASVLKQAMANPTVRRSGLASRLAEMLVNPHSG